MMRLEPATLGGRPQIAVSVSDAEPNEVVHSRGIDVLEIRVDQFENQDLDYILGSICSRRKTGILLLLTVRNDPAEGGCAGIDDVKKLRIFKAAASLVDAVDIELRSPLLPEVINIARQQRLMTIVSYHDVDRTPPESDLRGIVDQAKEKGADVVKIAVKANSLDDVQKLMLFTLQNKDRNVIILAMGRVGAISRLIFPLAGSLLTFGYVSRPSASGQIPLDLLQEDLKRYYGDRH
ncbi:MAG: type I 3-dehydroquinate dehydratase [Desulfobacterales bacterium]|nr:type I 3-dehydroquinate dehydratase [Desulfobacterales bacterium]MDD4071611.1 type I 3-dehydroquinate dehydratase [Desulfobacterales bacterium]MDD4392648.1 type I 3-dehydroquinate dehydratase [Desulfobacterales bacterium]